jgi:hypothetical protein
LRRHRDQEEQYGAQKSEEDLLPISLTEIRRRHANMMSVVYTATDSRINVVLTARGRVVAGRGISSLMN